MLMQHKSNNQQVNQAKQGGELIEEYVKALGTAGTGQCLAQHREKKVNNW